ncbi:phosphatase PAP2 family protein [Prevotella amnii]|uniref:phosphatase PAP2 family protein n=1 Tax=Prevotella amnii TaxID=419005 RepID=UPI00035F016B|nr:phosphatase PAP2 family protein [Prevotella amnii]
MHKFIRSLFRIEKKPLKGIMALEWVVMAYLILTLMMVLFMYTTVANPNEMIFGRLRIIVITLALWIVYRVYPCKLIRFIRPVIQLELLVWWYPDTYELNRCFPNMDHVFASIEQSIFGCQPALLFSKWLSGAVFSELFDMGYAAYYPMIALTALYYFGWHYKEFERCVFIILASFFTYYVIFIFVPVVGPTFYYKAVGVKNIMAGVFPNVHDYFNHNQSCLPSPGYVNGFFYNLVEDAKAAGERPTAAFPSSHVGISTICMLLLWHVRSKRLLIFMAPFYFFLCCATVYIQAHYLIDVFAGFVSALIFYFFFLWISRDIIIRGR